MSGAGIMPGGRAAGRCLYRNTRGRPGERRHQVSRPTTFTAGRPTDLVNVHEHERPADLVNVEHETARPSSGRAADLVNVGRAADRPAPYPIPTDRGPHRSAGSHDTKRPVGNNRGHVRMEKIFSAHALDPLLPSGYNAAMRTSEHKHRAAELGLEWSFVLELYREARELETADVERRTADRQAAFQQMSGDVHGGRFKAKNRAAFRDGGDCTSVAGIDVAAAGRGMTADELFEHLAADAPELRPADDVMREAIDRAARMTGAADVAAADGAADLVPLVSGALTADVTEQWLRQLVKAGRVRGRKAGRNWLVSLADCQAFRRHPTAGRPRSTPF